MPIFFRGYNSKVPTYLPFPFPWTTTIEHRGWVFCFINSLPIQLKTRSQVMPCFQSLPRRTHLCQLCIYAILRYVRLEIARSVSLDVPQITHHNHVGKSEIYPALTWLPTSATPIDSENLFWFRYFACNLPTNSAMGIKSVSPFHNIFALNIFPFSTWRSPLPPNHFDFSFSRMFR